MSTFNRVLKNSGYMYVNMALSVFVSLYSTRLILNALGTSDFGIFSIVGGAISMLGFLTACLSQSTQRYINFAEGQGNFAKKKKIFTVSILLHLLLAVIMIFLFEFAGWVFFNGVLNIPEERVDSAKWIYQLMIVSTFFSVMTAPYNALINAHEDFKYYSIMGGLQTVVKLLIAYLVVYVYTDKLIFYGFLMMAMNVAFLTVLRAYCYKKYEESRFCIRKYYDKELAKEMLSFSGWNLLNSASSMVAQYGMGIVLNSFFGTILSAAQGVANQISGQLMTFGRTMLCTVNPIIGKKAGGGDYKSMIRVTMFSCKAAFLILSVFAVPFLIETPYIMNLWLKNVPEWAVCFFRFEITRNLIEQLFISLTSAITAEGQIRQYSIVRGIIYFIPLPVTVLLFSLGFEPYWFYIVWIFFWSIVAGIVVVYFSNRNFHLSYRDFIVSLLVPMSLVLFCSFLVGCAFHVVMEETVFRCICVALSSCLSLMLSVWIIGFTHEEKDYIKSSMNIIKCKFVSRPSKW